MNKPESTARFFYCWLVARTLNARVPVRRLAGLASGIVMALTLASGSSLADSSAPVITGPLFEDFDGSDGSAPDPGLWTFDVGPSKVKGWEPGSLETYTDSPENVRLDGNGNLVITALRVGSDYTSGRITTAGKANFGFGRISARIKFPAGQGLWSAFWLLGADIGDVGWPECGEIDLMELINNGRTYHVAMHAPNGEAAASGAIADLTDDFHEYWVERRENSVRIGVDGLVLAAFTPESVPPGMPWVFNHPVYALLNLAVGGNWPGPPDDSTPFPATMTVDWFRYDPAA